MAPMVRSTATANVSRLRPTISACSSGDDHRVDLLGEIQSAAVDPNHSVSDLLRKCQILAFRLKHEPFKQWVAHELNGYPDGSSLPPYRAEIHGQLKAQTAGPFGSGANNIEVPLSLIPESVRDEATRFAFYQGVAVLESLVVGARAGGQGTIHSPFPVDLAARIEILEGHQTMRIWNEVPISIVSGILDQVRNRALNFALEIEAENPAAGSRRGETKQDDPPIPLARADVIFQTVIQGGQVAIGPNASLQVEVVPGDRESLMHYLEGLGVSDSDRADLRAALDEDATEDDSGRRPGKRVSAWLGRIGLTLASSGGRVSEGTVAGLIAAAVARYLGLAP